MLKVTDKVRNATPKGLRNFVQSKGAREVTGGIAGLDTDVRGRDPRRPADSREPSKMNKLRAFEHAEFKEDYNRPFRWDAIGKKERLGVGSIRLAATTPPTAGDQIYVKPVLT